MKIRTLSLALAAIAAPSMASAHFLWASLDVKTKTVSVGLGENPEDDPVSLMERVPRVKAWSTPSKVIALKEDGTYLRGATTAETVGVSINYGVLDKRDQGRGLFWLNYYAKAALTPEASQTKVGLAVELSVVMGAEGKPVVTVLHNGKPAPKAAIVAEIPGKEDAPFKGETAADGTITLPVINGKLAVRAQVTDQVKGQDGGKDYDFRRSYGSLTVQNLGGRAMTLADAKAYGILEKASLHRMTMPKEVKEITGSVEFVKDGKSVKAPFVFKPGTRATLDKTNLDAVTSAEVEAQVASIFNHRQSVPFANGNGKYDLKVVSEDEAGTLIAIGDGQDSTMRVKNDEIVEVSRMMHGNRFIITTLDTTQVAGGKSLPKIYTVTYFNPTTKALTKTQFFTDAYIEVNGAWLPSTREIKTAEEGKIATVQIKFTDLKVTR
jgi:hypothetical protein